MKHIKLFENFENEDLHHCDACKEQMSEGYVIDGGEQYFCSKKCLHTKYTDEQWESMYDDDGDSYWTVWEEEPQVRTTNQLEEDELNENRIYVGYTGKMLSKYKLIKEYPGSPELGTKVQETPRGLYYHKVNSDYPKTKLHSDENWKTKNSKYWKEIDKK